MALIGLLLLSVVDDVVVVARTTGTHDMSKTSAESAVVR